MRFVPVHWRTRQPRLRPRRQLQLRHLQQRRYKCEQPMRSFRRHTRFEGNLYVADSSNNRVLEYNTPLTNTTADTVFGQANLSSANFCSPNTIVSANTLCRPRGVALDVS